MSHSGNHVAFGPLLLRMGLGIIFMVHGLQKWIQWKQTVDFFRSLGLPDFLTYLVAGIETFAGVALFLGIFTPVAASLVALVMLGAMVTAKSGSAFVGGYEFDFLILLASISLIFTGPGTLSLANLLKNPSG